MTPSSKTQSGETKRYNAPALEKGLDILELLSTKTRPVSQSAIALELGRSTSEVFRMLTCLEDRGYIAKSYDSEGLVLTMRLHNLAHNWPPSKRLLEVALPEMRNFAEETNQSCHLGVYSSGRLYIAAQADSPLPVTISVKVTADFPLLRTASGRVLLAYQDKKIAEHWIAASEPDLSTEGRANLEQRLKNIRAKGVEVSESDRIASLTDISCPIIDLHGNAIAAVTVPYLNLLNHNTPIEVVRDQLHRTVQIISKQMGFGQ
tara:strand:+ start:74958 stop:75743 length:786 start_codon:yes stop_codon:yes gene_type:complete